MFQSTRPAWGRDGVSAQIESLERSFNPRAPRGGATGHCSRGLPCPEVSIHAPRVGARLSPPFSTCGSGGEVSIHAPRVGARPGQQIHKWRPRMFQSTRPAWGRDGVGLLKLCQHFLFQSTRPAWGRDERWVCGTYTARAFQSTRPAWGRDGRRPANGFSPFLFQSTRPAWGRDLVCYATASNVSKFQSTRPAWGRDVPF